MCLIGKISDEFKAVNKQNLDSHYCMSFIYE